MATLLACGGGGGGGSSIGPGGPTPEPSVCPSPNNAYPPTDCTQYTTTGTQTVQIVRSFPTPTPAATMLAWNLSDVAVVKTNQNFHSQAATEFATTETAMSPLETITTNDAIYYSFPTSGNILLLGDHASDSNGVVTDVQNLAGNGIVGQVPALAASWNNTAAKVITENDPDGTNSTQTFNNDGSYTLTKNQAAGQTTAAENSDGSGTAMIPSTAFFGFVGTGSQVTVTAPAAGPVTWTLSSVGAPAPTPTPIVISISPLWYGNPPVLASDTTANQGTQTIPASCNLPATLPAAGTQLHEVRSAVDTIFGIGENEVTDTWVQIVGPVCQRIVDTLNVYYDFSGQGPPAVFVVPVQTTTTTTTLGLQTVARADVMHRTARLLAAQRVFAVRLGAAEARLQRIRLGVRNRQLESLERLVRRRVGQ